MNLRLRLRSSGLTRRCLSEMIPACNEAQGLREGFSRNHTKNLRHG